MTSRSLALLILAVCACYAHDEHNLNTFQERVAILRLSVRSLDGAMIWEIRSVGRGVDAQVIRFGEVPPGFKQTVPPIGRPRSLHPGERLGILTVTPKAILCNRGTASRAGGVLVETYMIIPNSGATAAWRRQAEEIERCIP
jgi:hypothetical protein